MISIIIFLPKKHIKKAAAPLGSSEYSCPAPHCAHLEASPLPWLWILIELGYPWAIGFWTHLYHGLHCYITVHAQSVYIRHLKMTSSKLTLWKSLAFPMVPIRKWSTFMVDFPSHRSWRRNVLGLRALGAFCPKTSQGIPRNLGLEGMSVLRNHETWICQLNHKSKMIQGYQFEYIINICI